MPKQPITLLFLATIVGLPVAQAAWELVRGESIQALEVFGPLDESRLRSFEADLREASIIHQEVAPWYQWALMKGLSQGNEKSIVGNEGWLYFGENLDSVTRPAFGDAGRDAIRETILDFSQQLAAGGAQLILVPAPAKVAIQPEHLSTWTESLADANSAEVQLLFEELGNEENGPVIWSAAEGEALEFMPRDTHWTPQSMHNTAREVADLARKTLSAKGERLERATQWKSTPFEFEGSGDLTDMLRLPEGVQVYEPMQLELSRVSVAGTGAPFASDPKAEVLLLGDSFTLVFSDERLDMGSGSGFAEHLALQLEAPLDVIALTGGSARAVRETLARRAHGIQGKRVVVWQISLRDFNGEASKWSKVQLPKVGTTEVNEAADSTGPIRVRVELVELTRVPAEFEYPTCLAVHEYRLIETLSGSVPAGPLWIAYQAVKDFEPTEHANYQIGQQHILSLEDISNHFDLEQTSWMDNTGSDPRAAIWFPIQVDPAD